MKNKQGIGLNLLPAKGFVQRSTDKFGEMAAIIKAVACISFVRIACFVYTQHELQYQK